MYIQTKENYACFIDNLLYYGNIKPALKDEELKKLGIIAIICLLLKKSKYIMKKLDLLFLILILKII